MKKLILSTLNRSFMIAAAFSSFHFLPISVSAADSAPLKLETLSVTGDLRFRFVQLHEAADEPRLYQQLRARLGLSVDVQDDVKAVLRMATATSAVSNNQSLGDAKEPGMPRRSFGIDLAFGDWRFAESTHLMVGRIANPFYQPGKTQLAFDHDLAFEGGAVSWQPKWSSSGGFVNLGGFIISENYAAPNDIVDTGLVGLDIGYSLKSEGFGQGTVHAARFHFLNIADRPITSVDKDAKIDSYSSPFERMRGNTVYAINPGAALADRRYNFKSDFVQTEVGIDWKWKIDAVDLTLYGDGILNERASENGLAFETGLILKYGRVQLSLATSTKQSDSVVGAFTDSDFNGGGTDNRGSKITLAYQPSPATLIALTDYRATRGVDSLSRDYVADRLDFSLQF